MSGNAAASSNFPSAPIFGVAPGGMGGQLADYIALDDIFDDMIFSPDGELLDEPLHGTLQPSLISGDLTSMRGGAGGGPQFGVIAPAAGASGSPSSDAEQGGNWLEASPPSSPGGTGSSSKRKRPMPGEVLTEEQKLERRERNREHAKRSRVRKKFLLESLQKSVDALQNENDSLKQSIRQHLGNEGEAILEKCSPPPDKLVTNDQRSASRILDDPDYSLVKALQTAQQNFVITDASLPDNPIVYASGGFLTLTGYRLDQVLGRNCRFLQGPQTDSRAVDKIRRAIEKGEDTSVCLLNYRVDGSTFWNQFFVAGLRDSDGNTVNYVGVQCRVSDEYAAIVVQQQNKDLDREAQARAAGRAK